jgi:hypothetical protein
MLQEWDRRYSVYVMGVPYGGRQPWHRSAWHYIEAELAFVDSTARGPIALRGSALNRQADGSYKSSGLGRLAWNTKSSDKWTIEREDGDHPGQRKFSRQLRAGHHIGVNASMATAHQTFL